MLLGLGGVSKGRLQVIKTWRLIHEANHELPDLDQSCKVKNIDKLCFQACLEGQDWSCTYPADAGYRILLPVLHSQEGKHLNNCVQIYATVSLTAVCWPILIGLMLCIQLQV